MAYGFEVFNETGQVQFNDRTPNYFLVDQGFVDGGFSAGGLFGDAFFRTIWANVRQGNTGTFNNYFVAIRPVNGVGAVVSQDGFRQLPGTNDYVPRFDIYAQAANAQVHWYVFARGDVDAISALPAWGFVIWDEHGRITFRGDQKVLRVTDAVVGGTFTASRTLTPGRTYAFITGGRRAAFVNNQRVRLWGRVDGHNVHFYESIHSGGTLGYERFMSQLIVDVTNF